MSDRKTNMTLRTALRSRLPITSLLLGCGVLLIAPQVDSADSPPAAPAAVQLQFRYEPGGTLNYVTTDESTVEVEHASEGTTIRYATTVWKHFRVRSVEADGAAVLDLVFDRVRMSASGDEGSAEFDSDLPGRPPVQFAHVLDSIGRPTATFTVEPSGRIRHAEAIASAPGPRPSRDSAAVDRDIPSAVALPAQPVSVGDTWQEPFQIPVLMDETKLTRNIRLQRNYTLTAVRDGVATIDVDTVVLTPINDPKIEAQLLQRTPSGVALFDIARGVLLSKRTYLNNQVVGHEGPGSKVKVIRQYTETLANPAAETAAATLPAASVAQ